MAEDEAGFTFVDKRKAVHEEDASRVETAGNPSSESADKQPVPPDETSTGSDIGYDDQLPVEAPDIYELLQYCIRLLAADAWYKMGLIVNPDTGLSKPDLPQAKIAIDAVNDLINRIESAPENEVPLGIRRDLRTLLNDLRLNYVNQRNAIH